MVRKNTSASKASQQKSEPAEQIRPPRLVPTGIYSFQDIVHNMGISPHTLRKWTVNRVHKLQALDLGTKELFFSGADVIQFLTTFRHSVNGAS